MVITAAICELGKALLDFIYPRYCPVCRERLETDEPVCRPCLMSIGDSAKLYCGGDRTIDHAERVHVLLPYNAAARALIHDLKYHANPEAGVVLGELMGESLTGAPHTADAVIIPVPLHPKKMKSRGYNQSERIAAGIAIRTGLEIDESLVVRSRDTGTQTELSAEERKANVGGAFVYAGESNLKGRSIILVDDVLTTGSTVTGCAEVLKAHGAGEITVCVAATPDIGED